MLGIVTEPMRRWIPRRGRYHRFVSLSTSTPAKVLQNWLKFVRKNRHSDSDSARRSLLSNYVSQQVRAGLDPSTISQRLKTIRRFGIPTRQADITWCLDRIFLNLCIKKLKIMKNTKGTTHKEITSLRDLRRVYTEPRTGKDQQFQLLWYLLVVSGQRLGNLVDAEFVLEADGLRIFFLQGRKTDLSRLRCGLLFPFAWTETPPAHLQALMTNRFRVSNMGTKSNIASRMNTWLKKSGFDMTSGLPRTHLDNVLRRLLDRGLLSVDAFVRAMDHSISTSDKHYYC